MGDLSSRVLGASRACENYAMTVTRAGNAVVVHHQLTIAHVLPTQQRRITTRERDLAIADLAACRLGRRNDMIAALHFDHEPAVGHTKRSLVRGNDKTVLLSVTRRQVDEVKGQALYR